MKKTVILSLFTALFFTSCSDEDGAVYNGGTFVAFKEAQTVGTSISEDVGTHNFVIGISSPVSQPITVNVSYTNGTAIFGEHFSMPTSVVIPAGEMYADLPITIIDDSELNDSRTFSIKIESNSGDYKVGLVDEGSFTKNILIVNDECPSKFSYWFGAISVEDVGFGSTNGTGGANANGECDILVVVNDLPGAQGNAVAGTFNNKYNLKFTPDEEDSSFGTVDVNEFSAKIVNGGVTYDAIYVASGTYNTVTGKVILDYQLKAVTQAGVTAGTFWTGTSIITLRN
jgi:hypothetical protein